MAGLRKLVVRCRVTEEMMQYLNGLLIEPLDFPIR